MDESLRGLSRALLAGGRLNLEDYYAILAGAVVFLPVFKLDAAGSAVGFEIEGTHFGLLFLTADDAEPVLRRTSFAAVEHLSARDALRRIPDGWGVIVDWGTDSELRITPDAITELNERVLVRSVTAEATEEWLSRLNGELAHVPLAERVSQAMERWRRQNGFRVVPGSRRARAIEHFFAAHADGRRRCEDVWRSDYAAHPYLRHVDADELRARLEAILVNLAFADRPVAPHELVAHEWSELLQHVRIECEQRGIRCEEEQRASTREALTPRSVPRGKLFRFSKRRYLEPLLQTGALTIFPAAIYSDASLLPAQRDDELGRLFFRETSRMRMASRTNYYVWFATWAFDPRLFDDFSADACLVIHDARAFDDRLMRAIEHALPDPDWVGLGRQVRYFDPLRPRDPVLARFEKDFRYAYQREFRYAWEPTKEVRTTLPPLTCNLGPLGDICSLLPS